MPSGAPVLGRKRSAPRRPSSARERIVRRSLGGRPPGTSPVAALTCVIDPVSSAEPDSDRSIRSIRSNRVPPPAARATDAVLGCERRPARRRGRSQTPREAAMLTDREEKCTTTLRPGPERRPAPGARRRSVPGCARSSRQLVAALGSACFEHGPACTGTHAVAEAVLASPATVVWLVGALQRDPPETATAPAAGGHHDPALTAADAHERAAARAIAPRRERPPRAMRTCTG